MIGKQQGNKLRGRAAKLESWADIAQQDDEAKAAVKEAKVAAKNAEHIRKTNEAIIAMAEKHQAEKHQAERLEAERLKAEQAQVRRLQIHPAKAKKQYAKKPYVKKSQTQNLQIVREGAAHLQKVVNDGQSHRFGGDSNMAIVAELLSNLLGYEIPVDRTGWRLNIEPINGRRLAQVGPFFSDDDKTKGNEQKWQAILGAVVDLDNKVLVARPFVPVEQTCDYGQGVDDSPDCKYTRNRDGFIVRLINYQDHIIVTSHRRLDPRLSKWGNSETIEELMIKAGFCSKLENGGIHAQYLPVEGQVRNFLLTNVSEFLIGPKEKATDAPEVVEIFDYENCQNVLTHEGANAVLREGGALIAYGKDGKVFKIMSQAYAYARLMIDNNPYRLVALINWIKHVHKKSPGKYPSESECFKAEAQNFIDHQPAYFRKDLQDYLTNFKKSKMIVKAFVKWFSEIEPSIKVKSKDAALFESWSTKHNAAFKKMSPTNLLKLQSSMKRFLDAFNAQKFNRQLALEAATNDLTTLFLNTNETTFSMHTIDEFVALRDTLAEFNQSAQMTDDQADKFNQTVDALEALKQQYGPTFESLIDDYLTAKENFDLYALTPAFVVQ